MTIEDLRAQLGNRYCVDERRHGLAILTSSFGASFQDIVDAIGAFFVRRSEVDVAGGNKTDIASRLDEYFVQRDWQELSVEVKSELVLTRRRKKPKRLMAEGDTRVDRYPLDARTHYIDCVKESVALDVEWNAKETAFARDLGAFRTLHELGIISVGVIITRGPTLQQMLCGFGKAYREKYSATTTHWDQLKRFVDAGTAGACPLVLFGIEPGCYINDVNPG